MSSDLTKRALVYIEQCSDVAKLRKMIVNGRDQNEHEVVQAARLRLYELLPSEAPGTLEHDVWRCIHALEDALTDERGKTTRLARTRQKISRDGEHKTVLDLVNGKQSSGFEMMIERDMPQFTFEALTLRHSDRFNEQCLTNARLRLDAANVLGSMKNAHPVMPDPGVPC